MSNESTPGQAPSEAITETPAAPAPAAASENITATPPARLPADATTAPVVPAPGPTKSPAWLLKADLVILAMLLVLAFFLGSFTATNSDLWMHLAIGQRISEGQFVFGEDPYSWLTEATADTPAPFWVHQSWLYSWLFFQLHELVGGAGLVLIKAILFTIAVGLLSRIGWNETNRWFVLIALVTAALAVSPRLLLDPMVMSFLFLSITLFVLDRVGCFAHARPDGKAPCPRLLWVLPPLFALWANLDAWFILGPMVLGLCWAGAGLTRWFPDAKVVPAKTLGLIFGVGVLACVVNPYHVRVFQLPPELAYLVVSVTDAIHLRLPNEIVGAGRTLSEMRKGDDNFAWTIPAVSAKYWYEPRLGWNIAGMSVFPLLLLGLLAFTLTARVKSQPGAPTFHVGRFVLWLVFGVMALALWRMIPFFAIVAAPLTAMTLGEFLNWQQTVSAIPAEKRDRGLMLARFVSIPFVLLLIFLGWPGWLHRTTDFASLRRVAWDVRAEPSVKQTAQTLLALKNEGKCQNVFNGMNLEVAQYMSWFAPEVKFGIDGRFALYAECVAEYAKARKALGTQESAEWEDYFAKHKVDQVVVVNFFGARRGGGFPVHFWLETDKWRQRGGDARSVIFSWAGRSKRWPADDDAAWNHAAFGRVPEEHRPPAAGVMLPRTPSALNLYLDGVAPTPIGVAEFHMLKKRYGFCGEMRNLVGRPLSLGWMISSWTCEQGVPDGVICYFPALATRLCINLPPRDLGPPALPILMVRSTRQAVAENPLDVQSRVRLIEALDLRKQQENHWIGVYAPAALRERVRRVQLVANRNVLTQLQPENFEFHRKFAEELAREKMLDLALEHMQAAEKALEAYRPPDAKEQKALDEERKRYREGVQELDKAVRQRQAKWKDLSGTLPAGKLSSQEMALQKAALAFVGEFEELRGDKPVRAQFGLGKKAFEILAELDEKSFSDRGTELAYMNLSYQVLLAMGRANDVMTSLKKEGTRKGMPPYDYAFNQLLAGAALGDYNAMEEALAVLEKISRENLGKAREVVRERTGRIAPLLLMVPKVGSATALAAAVDVIDRPPYPLTEGYRMRELLHQQHNELSNTITLRGIIALESGNTEHARVLFQRALDEAGEDNLFTERGIARRYLDLLIEQKR